MPTTSNNNLRQPFDEGVGEAAASKLAKTSTMVDPAPHYIMSAAMAGAALLSYSRLANPTSAIIAGGISAGYFLAGRFIEMGNHTLGYDLGSLTSAGKYHLLVLHL